jgi:hypothetical protein
MESSKPNTENTMPDTPAAPVAVVVAAPAVVAKPAAKAEVKAAAKPSAKPAKKVSAQPVAVKKVVAAAKKVAAKTTTTKTAVAKPVVKAVAKPVAKPATKAAPKAAAAKQAKEKKIKMVRDSISIPKAEYAVLDDMKLRAGKLAVHIKKTELIRAGIKLLAALPDAAFQEALRAVPSLKTGRPSKSA